MSPTRVLRGFIFGALGGFVGWALGEFLPLPFPFQPARYESGPSLPLVDTTMQGVLGAAVGLAIGGFLGLSEGIAAGTASRFRRILGWFLALGAMGGFLSLYFGQTVWSGLGARSELP